MTNLFPEHAQAPQDGGTPRRFDTVLVANRGEIARRIIRTLRRLGLRSVAVYSDADANALHTREADEAVYLGPSDAAASYLNIPALLAAAKKSGAQAIHPGYGFLSENADFARAVADAGLTFIGPSEQAIRAMADKIQAKKLVSGLGLPTIPGTQEPGLSDEQLAEQAQRIGFPVLVKPAAGGGGKGMEVARDLAELAPKLASARRVAAKAFGDDTLFLERYIANPRHIEIQILADSHGTVVHVGERECSLQRRHQKIIEEAPSPLLDPATRERMGHAAIEIAKAVGYEGAGTVEFLVSADKPDTFFFMEMNTRLQVEHPVSEQVSGLDLVECQVRAAQGERIAWQGDGVELRGHSIQARIYAEDPDGDFLPCTGRIAQLREPVGDGVRVDSSLFPGQEITGFYDPMLAKVIASGPTREAALERLVDALGHTVIFGVRTNLNYLRNLLLDADVRRGELDTGLIERKLGELTGREIPAQALATAARAVRKWAGGDGAAGEADRDGAAVAPGVSEAWARDGFTFGGTSMAAPLVLEQRLGQQTREYTVPGIAPMASDEGVGASDDVALLRDGVPPGASSRPDALGQRGLDVWVRTLGFTGTLHAPSRRERVRHILARAEQSGSAGAASPEAKSPMPGTVVSLAVATGDTVRAGQTLGVVEAMKMEHNVSAPRDGIVTVLVAPGQSISASDVFARVQDAADAQSEGNHDAV